LDDYIFDVRFKALAKQGTVGMARKDATGQLDDMGTSSNPTEIGEQMGKEGNY
jgi:hypothetical protein